MNEPWWKNWMNWLFIVVAAVLVVWLVGYIATGVYNAHFRCDDGYEWVEGDGPEANQCVPDEQIEEDFG